MKNVGSSLNDLWSRRSSDDLRINFDPDDFPKILEWSLISKIFRRFLIVLWYQRSSEGHWMVFDLDYLKILKKHLISKSFRKSLNYLWPKNFSQDPWMIFDHEERREFLEWILIAKIFRSSSNEIGSRRSFAGPWMVFDIDDLPKVLEWSLISKVFRRSFIDDFTGISLDLMFAAMSINWLSKSIELFFSQSQFSKRSNLIGMSFFKNIFQLAYKLLRNILW